MNFLAHYNIAINPVGLNGAAASKYSSDVNEHLTWIYRTTTGRILLNSIKFHGVPVAIEPYTVGGCNSTGGNRRVGTALNGFVAYSPNTFSLHGACSATKLKANRGLFWDEILFHELVHVFRAVSGKWMKRPLIGGLFRYTDTEEFYAVLLSNIYISDRTNKIKSGLRANHQGFNPLQPALAEPFGFFSSGTQVFSLVEQLCTDNPGLAKRIAVDAAKAQFNPLADYYASRERAEKLSKEAGSRDVLGVIEEMLKL